MPSFVAAVRSCNGQEEDFEDDAEAARLRKEVGVSIDIDDSVAQMRTRRRRLVAGESISSPEKLVAQNGKMATVRCEGKKKHESMGRRMIACQTAHGKIWEKP